MTLDDARDLIRAAGGDPEAVRMDQFLDGIVVEGREHADVVQGPVDVARVVLSHLRERPDYYTMLSKAEKSESLLEFFRHGPFWVVEEDDGTWTVRDFRTEGNDVVFSGASQAEANEAVARLFAEWQASSPEKSEQVLYRRRNGQFRAESFNDLVEMDVYERCPQCDSPSWPLDEAKSAYRCETCDCEFDPSRQDEVMIPAGAIGRSFIKTAGRGIVKAGGKGFWKAAGRLGGKAALGAGRGALGLAGGLARSTVGAGITLAGAYLAQKGIEKGLDAMHKHARQAINPPQAAAPKPASPAPAAGAAPRRPRLPKTPKLPSQRRESADEFSDSDLSFSDHVVRFRHRARRG